MSKNSSASNLSRRSFLAAAGTVAAANSFVVGKAVPSEQNTMKAPAPPPSDSYVVTVKLADDGSFSYDYSKNGAAPVPMPSKDLTVLTGNDVQWQSTLPNSHRHRASVRFTTTTPFGGANEFKWSENQKKGGRVTETNLSTHYYSVAVYDKHKDEIFTDDPKIIVGGR